MDYQNFFLGIVCLLASVLALASGLREPSDDETESNVLITKSNNYGIYFGSAVGIVVGIYMIINSFGV